VPDWKTAGFSQEPFIRNGYSESGTPLADKESTGGEAAGSSDTNTLSGREIHMSTHVGIEQSGKSGGEAVGFSGSSSMGLGGGAAGMASAGGLGFSSAGAEATGGDALSGSNAAGALGGDVSDNTQIGSISINS
jgi:hypothetical protein